MQIRESAEDYLEAILVLSKKGEGVRSVDIASMLGVSKPSVSHAMKAISQWTVMVQLHCLRKAQRLHIEFMKDIQF